jgi:hypothetical protein
MDIIAVFKSGRLGNRLIGNLALHYLCRRYNFPVEYTRLAECNRLGLQFHVPTVLHGTPTILPLSDSNFVELLTADVDPSVPYRFQIQGEPYYQSRSFAEYLKKEFSNSDQQATIVAANPFKARYNTNRDVFVHMRLGDMAQAAPSDAYFEAALRDLVYDKGYIASDSPTHPRVQAFAAKHDFQIIVLDEVSTLQFASTCRHLILSHGTFSWWMGILGFYSTVQWPAIHKPWHGDIFVFPEWRMIDWM